MTRHIVITGASGALGQALAKAYAQAGVKLWLQGRRQAALAQLAQDCQTLGAQTVLVPLDLRERAAVQAWGQELAQSEVDLLLVNAGVNLHPDAQTHTEDPQASLDLFEVNLLSAIALVQSVVPAMQQRGCGQIALISSLAAWRGLPQTPSYSASKSGLKAYGEGLRSTLAHDGIGVSVVLAGYIESPMCDAMPGPKPFLLSPHKAAQKIKQGLGANRGRIAFPFWLSLGCQIMAALPDGLAAWLLARLGYVQSQPLNNDPNKRSPR